MSVWCFNMDIAQTIIVYMHMYATCMPLVHVVYKSNQSRHVHLYLLSFTVEPSCMYTCTCTNIKLPRDLGSEWSTYFLIWLHVHVHEHSILIICMPLAGQPITCWWLHASYMYSPRDTQWTRPFLNCTELFFHTGLIHCDYPLWTFM